MLRLLVVRHAKSSWKHPELQDHERPLNKRGREDAPLMGRVLKARGQNVDRFYSSSAIRAFLTAKLLAKELACDLTAVQESEELYNADLYLMLDVIRNKVPGNERTVAVIGHNPTITDFANYLIAGQEELDFKTCAIAAIDFHVDRWDQIAPAKGELAFFEYPKKHK